MPIQSFWLILAGFYWRGCWSVYVARLALMWITFNNIFILFFIFLFFLPPHPSSSSQSLDLDNRPKVHPRQRQRRRGSSPYRLAQSLTRLTLAASSEGLSLTSSWVRHNLAESNEVGPCPWPMRLNPRLPSARSPSPSRPLVRLGLAHAWRGLILTIFSKGPHWPWPLSGCQGKATSWRKKKGEGKKRKKRKINKQKFEKYWNTIKGFSRQCWPAYVTRPTSTLAKFSQN